MLRRVRLGEIVLKLKSSSGYNDRVPIGTKRKRKHETDCFPKAPVRRRMQGPQASDTEDHPPLDELEVIYHEMMMEEIVEWVEELFKLWTMSRVGEERVQFEYEEQDEDELVPWDDMVVDQAFRYKHSSPFTDEDVDKDIEMDDYQWQPDYDMLERSPIPSPAAINMAASPFFLSPPSSTPTLAVAPVIEDLMFPNHHPIITPPSDAWYAIDFPDVDMPQEPLTTPPYLNISPPMDSESCQNAVISDVSVVNFAPESVSPPCNANLTIDEQPSHSRSEYADEDKFLDNLTTSCREISTADLPAIVPSSQVLPPPPVSHVSLALNASPSSLICSEVPVIVPTTISPTTPMINLARAIQPLLPGPAELDFPCPTTLSDDLPAPNIDIDRCIDPIFDVIQDDSRAFRASKVKNRRSTIAAASGVVTRTKEIRHVATDNRLLPRSSEVLYHRDRKDDAREVRRARRRARKRAKEAEKEQRRLENSKRPTGIKLRLKLNATKLEERLQVVRPDHAQDDNPLDELIDALTMSTLGSSAHAKDLSIPSPTVLVPRKDAPPPISRQATMTTRSGTSVVSVPKHSCFYSSSASLKIPSLAPSRWLLGTSLGGFD
ncbi:hypothetical protein A0H81_02935 [Grifola frondosa]|uniref:Uncharacterized protein n=1 Tax=Grifola frondosa TaxID=5627 RepID=A0A1C7MMS1_GRIFR|nr:hypothetical protein A0H81_02935 [Grifola frondosa]